MHPLIEIGQLLLKPASCNSLPADDYPIDGVVGEAGGTAAGRKCSAGGRGVWLEDHHSGPRAVFLSGQPRGAVSVGEGAEHQQQFLGRFKHTIERDLFDHSRLLVGGVVGRSSGCCQRYDPEISAAAAQLDEQSGGLATVGNSAEPNRW